MGWDGSPSAYGGRVRVGEYSSAEEERWKGRSRTVENATVTINGKVYRDGNGIKINCDKFDRHIRHFLVTIAALRLPRYGPSPSRPPCRMAARDWLAGGKGGQRENKCIILFCPRHLLKIAPTAHNFRELEFPKYFVRHFGVVAR